MKLKKFLPTLFTLPLMAALAACSSDSSSASRDVDSSSSGTGSSSSVEGSSSSAFDTENLLTNMDLGKKFGTKLWLSAGKNGLYSLWFIDTTSSETSYGTIATYADLSSGVLSFDSTSGLIYATNNAAGDSVLAWTKRGIKLEFSVKDSTTQVSIDGADPVEVKKATRQIDKAYLSKAETLEGTILEWSAGDSVSTYRFYKNGEYIRTATLGSEIFEAGHYDVHRQHLLLVPAFFAGSVSTVTSYAAKIGNGGYILDNQLSAREYRSSSLSVEYPKVSTLEDAAWSSESNDTLKWTLSFSGDEYSLRGKTGLNDNTTKILRSGEWAVFGDYLVLSVEVCSAVKTISCPSVERGQLIDLEEASFLFENSDPDDEYSAPRKWSLIEEE